MLRVAISETFSKLVTSRICSKYFGSCLSAGLGSCRRKPPSQEEGPFVVPHFQKLYRRQWLSQVKCGRMEVATYSRDVIPKGFHGQPGNRSQPSFLVRKSRRHPSCRESKLFWMKRCTEQPRPMKECVVEVQKATCRSTANMPVRTALRIEFSIPATTAPSHKGARFGCLRPITAAIMSGRRRVGIRSRF